jgi:hypothetical protein
MPLRGVTLTRQRFRSFPDTHDNLVHVFRAVEHTPSFRSYALLCHPLAPWYQEHELALTEEPIDCVRCLAHGALPP